MDKYESLKLQVTVIGRPPYFCEFYLQELGQVLPINIKEKSFHATIREKEERKHFETYQSTLFFFRPALWGN